MPAFVPPSPLNSQARPAPQLLPQQACPLPPHAAHIPPLQRLDDAVHVIVAPAPGNPVPPPAPLPPPAPVAPQQIWPTAPHAVPVPSWHEPLLQVPVTPVPPPVHVEPLAWHMLPTQQPPSLQLFAAQQRWPSPPQVAPVAPPALAPPVPTTVPPPLPVVAWPPVPVAEVPPVPVVTDMPPEPEPVLLLLEQAASAISNAANGHAARDDFDGFRSRDRCGAAADKRRFIVDLQF